MYFRDDVTTREQPFAPPLPPLGSGRCVDLHGKRNPALKSGNYLQSFESVGYDVLPIGTDWDPARVKLLRSFNSLAEISSGPLSVPIHNA
jgi:hypothetical protein